jgi:hypothetical protein
MYWKDELALNGINYGVFQYRTSVIWLVITFERHKSN